MDIGIQNQYFLTNTDKINKSIIRHVLQWNRQNI
jgi:hypothetical protein